MSTAIAPNVAEMIRPKWWNVRAFHSGFSLTASSQHPYRQSYPALPTCLVLVDIALALLSSTKERHACGLVRVSPRAINQGVSNAGSASVVDGDWRRGYAERTWRRRESRRGRELSCYVCGRKGGTGDAMGAVPGERQ